jgi:hypothetical protein
MDPNMMTQHLQTHGLAAQNECAVYIVSKSGQHICHSICAGQGSELTAINKDGDMNRAPSCKDSGTITVTKHTMHNKWTNMHQRHPLAS